METSDTPKPTNIFSRDLSPRADTPRDVQFIAWLAIIGAVLQILGSLVFFTLSPISALISLVIACVWIVVAWYLMKLMLWVWTLFELALLVSIARTILGLAQAGFEFPGNETNYFIITIGLVFFLYLLSVKRKFA